MSLEMVTLVTLMTKNLTGIPEILSSNIALFAVNDSSFAIIVIS